MPPRDYSDKGLWHATYGQYDPRPPLAASERADVAIVGGGFTGIATAYHLLAAEPSLDVRVLESEVVGYGASGRNGSFAMTVVGLGLDVVAKVKGRDFALASHRYMERAVDLVGDLVEREGLDCDYTRPGFLRMATTPAYVKRLRKEVALAQDLGLDGIEWLDREQARAQVSSELYLGAWWEPRTALMNPLKLVRGLARAVDQSGGVIHEQTPVTSIARDHGGFSLTTPAGRLRADRLVLATNAYSHLLEPTRRKQVPAWTYIVATAPLAAEQLAEIGWRDRQGVEDARNLIHYYRLTPDDRLLMGGGPVGLAIGDNMDRDVDHGAWRHLEEHIAQLFPVLRGVPVTHRWGGPFSITTDLTPAIGTIGDGRCVYALGCIGHGVSMTHLNGRVIAHMLLGRDDDVEQCPFVRHRVIPWPPEPLRYAAGVAMRLGLQAQDWFHERRGPPHAA
jgi:glycine/D-amino acid oxidase-like deaminating enzyme